MNENYKWDEVLPSFKSLWTISLLCKYANPIKIFLIITLTSYSVILLFSIYLVLQNSFKVLPFTNSNIIK